MKTIFFAVAMIAATAAGAVTVPNGDFEAGNTGFTSSYVYGPAANELFTGPPQQGAGYYAVTSNANFNHSLFTSFGDHTSGKGLYFIANGSTLGGTVYTSSPIAVVAGKRYTFGAFFANAYPASPANLDFQVALDGGPATSLGSFTIPGGSGVWNGASKFFSTGAATSVTLSFVDLNKTAGGNDFGIDDITLSAVPEPAAWALMIAGFGFVGLGLRRRTSALAA